VFSKNTSIRDAETEIAVLIPENTTNSEPDSSNPLPDPNPETTCKELTTSDAINNLLITTKIDVNCVESINYSCTDTINFIVS
jgi:hypothetical protein